MTKPGGEGRCMPIGKNKTGENDASQPTSPATPTLGGNKASKNDCPRTFPREPAGEGARDYSEPDKINQRMLTTPTSLVLQFT